MTTSPPSQAGSLNRVLAVRPWLLALIVLFILTATFGGYEIQERLVLASRLDMQTLLLLLIFLRIFPCLTIWEMREGLEQATPEKTPAPSPREPKVRWGVT